MDRDAELERLLAEYLEAAEAGAAPPPAVWVERHPGYRAELAEFFALRRDFEALAAPIRDAAPRRPWPTTDSRYHSAATRSWQSWGAAGWEWCTAPGWTTRLGWSP